MSHVAQSLSGLTAGKVMEGFKNIVGRVGGEARRLKADAIRVQQVCAKSVHRHGGAARETSGKLENCRYLPLVFRSLPELTVLLTECW